MLCPLPRGLVLQLFECNLELFSSNITSKTGSRCCGAPESQHGGKDPGIKLHLSSLVSLGPCTGMHIGLMLLPPALVITKKNVFQQEKKWVLLCKIIHTLKDGGIFAILNEIFVRDYFQTFHSNYAEWGAALQWEERTIRVYKELPKQHLPPYYCS